MYYKCACKTLSVHVQFWPGFQTVRSTINDKANNSSQKDVIYCMRVVLSESDGLIKERCNVIVGSMICNIIY